MALKAEPPRRFRLATRPLLLLLGALVQAPTVAVFGYFGATHGTGLGLRSRRAVKEILMDQRVLAGIGNILATEALWTARVDPRSPGAALWPADARAVATGLRRAIARELADKDDTFFVYGQTGEPRPRCGTRLSSAGNASF